MADKKHLKRLKQGVETWNRWRKENLGVQVDLREAELNQVHLYEANLNGAHLSGAHLSGAA